MTDDPLLCRRALREIGEIAAVAVLQDSRMASQEALESIAAIAEWVSEAAPDARPDCADVVSRVHRLTHVDLDALDDAASVRLFRDVVRTLKPAGGAD